MDSVAFFTHRVNFSALRFVSFMVYTLNIQNCQLSAITGIGPHDGPHQPGSMTAPKPNNSHLVSI